VFGEKPTAPASLRITPFLMRSLLEKWTAFCADRLTVQERWMVLAFLGIVVLGSFVKYSRARPELDPSSAPLPTRSTQPSTDDPQ
jgi:hypothetical protein